jgi:hypothetical protein
MTMTVPPYYPQQGYRFKNYSAATAGDQVKTGPGLLFAVSVNTSSSGSSVTLYDGTSTSGTKIGTYSAATSSGACNFLEAAPGLAFQTGLFLVMTGTGADVTVKYF